MDELTFFLKPLNNMYVKYPAMRYLPFRCNPERLRLTNDGFDVMRLKNVPAYHEESYSPPVYGTRQWILVYYEENSKSGKDQYWTTLDRNTLDTIHRKTGSELEISDVFLALTEAAPSLSVGSRYISFRAGNAVALLPEHIRDCRKRRR